MGFGRQTRPRALQPAGTTLTLHREGAEVHGAAGERRQGSQHRCDVGMDGRVQVDIPGDLQVTPEGSEGGEGL